MPDTWIEQVLPLNRPEYARQPEALLTDLIWRSRGSSLPDWIELPRGSKLARLVPRYKEGAKPVDIVETMPLAETADTSALVLDQGLPKPVGALLNSIVAPQSRGDKSLAYVPVHPDIAAFQTLNGLVNKAGPPNLASIIETVGWLGGSRGLGAVAHLFLTAIDQPAAPLASFTGFVDALLPVVSRQTWRQLIATAPDAQTRQYREWQQVGPGTIGQQETSILASYHLKTPFAWFWRRWQSLCDPANGWIEVLPQRRFTDWATCLLRTGLSFAYLWEAAFFVLVHEYLEEELRRRRSPSNLAPARAALEAMLANGGALATIESARVPATQKDAWKSMRRALANGYAIRDRLEQHLKDERFEFSPPTGVPTGIAGWLASLPTKALSDIVEDPLLVDTGTGNNTAEFVKYLLRPRATDDDSQDQADFYFLARMNAKGMLWFQPGPEWLVVETSLRAERSGGRCTVGMVLDDLRSLGLRVERRVLVSMLEQAGLSTDSPDADNALVIQAAF